MTFDAFTGVYLVLVGLAITCWALSRPRGKPCERCGGVWVESRPGAWLHVCHPRRRS